MQNDIFAPADILLPSGVAPEIWSVIACDQFSSERDYWQRVREKVGETPSTFNMIIPEAYLDDIDEAKEIERIRAAMDDYLGRGLLREIVDSFVYVERTQPDGRVRRGLVGIVDLEQYDFSGGEAAILASEGTVLGRLPARIRVRSAARLELPHIMTFINDSGGTVIEPLAAIAGELPQLYDFDLMEGGGHVKGMRVTGVVADRVMAALRALGGKSRTLMVMGDGNHSLAAAKAYWDELKHGLDEEARENHPARRALLEVNNLYDPAITFEAIHRTILGVKPADLIGALEKVMKRGAGYELRWISREGSGAIDISADSYHGLLTELQGFLDDYTRHTGSQIDYIHGVDAVKSLTENENCLGLILPAMDKSELFATVSSKGAFPRKSFSVGHAKDKRYYLECRGISIDR